MKPQHPRRTDRLVTARTNRRRFLAGIAAAGLTLPASIASEATRSSMAQRPGGAVMARQTGDTAATAYLTVPGASLYYEVSGSGPVLLLIPGGPADAGIFALIVDPLAANYTVVR